MMLHQDVVKKAQLEIEHVLGYNRLLTLEDRPILPYTNCVLKEVIRCAKYLFYHHIDVY